MKSTIATAGDMHPFRDILKLATLARLCASASRVRWAGGYVSLRRVVRSLAAHQRERCVVILEYEVHGEILSSGARYDNRLISVVTIENRKIVHWRDYMDSLAAWAALNGSSQ